MLAAPEADRAHQRAQGRLRLRPLGRGGAAGGPGRLLGRMWTADPQHPIRPLRAPEQMRSLQHTGCRGGQTRPRRERLRLQRAGWPHHTVARGHRAVPGRGHRLAAAAGQGLRVARRLALQRLLLHVVRGRQPWRRTGAQAASGQPRHGACPGAPRRRRRAQTPHRLPRAPLQGGRAGLPRLRLAGGPPLCGGHDRVSGHGHPLHRAGQARRRRDLRPERARALRAAGRPAHHSRPAPGRRDSGRPIAPRTRSRPPPPPRCPHGRCGS
jgi:hypothetical protein